MVIFWHQCKLVNYLTGQKYSLELMFANFATAKNAKNLIPLKVSTNSKQLQWGLTFSLTVPQNSYLRSTDYSSDDQPIELPSQVDIDIFTL